MIKLTTVCGALMLCVSTIATALEEDSQKNRYGADQYGMKQYVMAFLTRGPNSKTLSKQRLSELQGQHMANIDKMATAKQLVLAGPFLDNGELRGIYIFNTKSVEQAKLWTETDPAIKAGSLQLELKPWYGSAALMAVNDIHNEISQQPK